MALQSAKRKMVGLETEKWVYCKNKKKKGKEIKYNGGPRTFFVFFWTRSVYNAYWAEAKLNCDNTTAIVL